MEEKEILEKKEEPQEQERPPVNKSVADGLKNQNIYEQYQKENIQSNEGKEDEIENNNNPNSLPQNELNNNNSQNANNDNSPEKNNKRRRRGKNDINDRKFKCPDCEKCYLSGPALTTHRKNKHGYGTNGERKSRGRPKALNDNVQINPATKFKDFFNDEKRKSNSLDESLNDKIITTDIIKEYLIKIFNQCKDELFKDIDSVENYSFCSFILDNWDKKDPFPDPECYRAVIKKEEPSIKVQSYNLDELFFLYLKEFSKKTNEEYFWFMIKFVVLFRECINRLKKDLVKEEHQTGKNLLYSQVYNAETVPEICNDFFVKFMEPYTFFGMYKLELIELIQHFCYWLYSKQYTQSHLTLLDN
jgi:hypothetical protein